MDALDRAGPNPSGVQIGTGNRSSRPRWQHRGVAEGIFPSRSGNAQITALFQTGGLEITLRVRVKARDPQGEESWTIPVKAGEGPAAQFTQTAMTHAVFLVGTLGNPGGLTEMEGSVSESAKPEETQGRETPIRVVSLKDPSRLILSPPAEQSQPFANATGLEALDALVISGQYAMPPAAATALKNWVTLGGHLILSVGRNLDELPEQSLSQWVSGESGEAGEAAFRITGVTQYRDLSCAGNLCRQVRTVAHQPPKSRAGRKTQSRKQHPGAGFRAERPVDRADPLRVGDGDDDRHRPGPGSGQILARALL